MGVDLTLLPMSSSELSLTSLETCRRRELWPKILALPSREVAESFHNRITGNPPEDKYGQWIKYVFVRDLMTLASDPAVTDNWENWAAWAYISKMSPDARVALYWH
jgi:hypothetical protein